MKKNYFNLKNKGSRTIVFMISLFLMTTAFPVLQGGFTNQKEITNSSVTIVPDSVSQESTLENTEVNPHTTRDADPLTITIDQSQESTIISYSIHEYTTETLEIDDEIYHKVILGGEPSLVHKGYPELPKISRSVIVDDTAKMDTQIINVNYETIDIRVPPSKGDILRTVDPATVPHEFADVYIQDTWYPNKVAELSDPYILRDYRGQVVTVYPFQYNPIHHQLRVYTDITLEVVKTNVEDTLNCIHRSEFPEKIDADFEQIYKRHFVNYGEPGLTYTPVTEIGNMLIITYDTFWDTMVPFLEWKNMKGIPTEMVNVSDVGTTASAIDTYIENYYLTNGLTFVLLVGDIAQIPSLESSYAASDPSYTYVDGIDHYPDLFIGRFSASNTADLQTQVERTIEYEKYPQLGDDWYAKGVGVGSDEGTGDDNEWDWEHIRNIRTDLLGYTYSQVDEIYGGSQGGQDADGNPSAADLNLVLNEGRSILNYCGHGGPQEFYWNSAGSWYTNDDIDDLTNDNMLPFMWIVACKCGMFDDYDACFAEKLMREVHNGEPTGAIAVFAGSDNQPWDPPMAAQDEMNDILVETYPANIQHSFGALSFQGCMLMNDEYGSSYYYVTDQWTIFGDPSLQVRTDTPADITVNHNPIILEGVTSFDVEVVGLDNALCAISYNYELLGYAYTDENGQATITFTEPISDIDEVDLVITGYNTETYITTLQVVSKRQPAEFEHMDGVLVRYPLGLPVNMIAEMSEDVIVTTIVASTSEQTTVENMYSSAGVTMANTDFLIAPSDTYWTRDYGPWFIYNVNNELEVVDFTYNRPRPDDNAIPNAFAVDQGLNLSFMNLETAGGNYMTDGEGIAISTDLVYTENPGLTPSDIDEMVADYLGIHTYHVADDALGEYIEHIDCWAKLLSPDTIMIIEVPPSHSQYDELEAAVSYFENQISCYGTPYDIVRVYTPDGEPYINSLILNDKVFVPMDGTSSWDDDAITSYQTAMPGYEVLGFTGSWETTDAIHCRAKGIPDIDMIYIDHTPLSNGFPSDNGFLVNARVVPYSDLDLIPESVLLYWQLDERAWNSVQMTHVGGDYYQAYIPPQPCGETVQYYIHAEDTGGNIIDDPYIGAADPYAFDVTLVPEIWIDPESYSINSPSELTVTETLTIGNDEIAGENLTFDITYTNTDGWLSVTPTTGELQPNSTIEIDVILSTYGLDVGIYQETIHVSSNDPDEPLLEIPITLNIVLANDVGTLSINYPTEVAPPDSYAVNATVTNYGSADQTDVVVNCTIIEGSVSYEEDFEIDDGGYTHDVGPGSGTYDDWEWGTPTSGPSSAHSGVNVWATNLAGNFNNYGDMVLDSIPIDLLGFVEPQLTFWHWYDFTGGAYDGGNVKISTDNGATWTLIYPEGGYPDTASSSNTGIPNEPCYTNGETADWTEVTFDLTSYEGETILLRWHCGTTTVTPHLGWYIDDVCVSSASRDTGDIIYSAETTVDLDAYQTKDIEFSPVWNALPGTYGIKVTTLLPGDQETANDKKTTGIQIIAANDGGVTTINYPTGLNRPGDFTVNVTAKNYGSVGQIIPLECEIYDDLDTLVYSSTTSVFIDPLKEKFAEFSPPWSVSEEGIYSIQVASVLSDDAQPNNDAWVIDVQIQPFTDVACAGINYPTGIIQPGDIYVNASIENLGDQDESIPVLCTINDGLTDIYSTVESIYIPALSDDHIVFTTPWSADPGDYTIQVQTMLFGDEVQANNLSDTAVSVIPGYDTGVTAINYPTGIQRPGNYIINATVENFGSISHMVPITCEIYDQTSSLVYSETEDVYVELLSSRYVDFSSAWSVITPDDYTIQVFTQLPGDEYPENDGTELIVTIQPYTDVGVHSINYPTGEHYAGNHIVNATIENNGDTSQLVTVNCTITEGIFGTFLYENFTQGYPPAGWVEEEPDNPEWELRPNNYAGGTAPEIRLRWSLINGDYSYLDTPPVDTNGAANLHLKFNHYIEDFAGNDNDIYCRVYTRADQADTWTDVTPWTNPIHADVGPQYETIPIGHDVGSGTQVRFEYDGYYYDIDYWNLDDVEIVSEETRDPGDIVYTCEQTMEIDALSTAYCDFIPSWNAIPGIYGMKITTSLTGDENPSNNQMTATTIMEQSPYLCGDVNDDGLINVSDAVFIINYVFLGSSAPDPLCIGDANGDDTINVSDAVYLINYIFIPGSPAPVGDCCD